MLRMITILSALALGPTTLAAVPAAQAALTTQAAAAPTQVQAAVPVIVWHDCDGSQCARVMVPLDYDDPTGAQTPLHLLKVPAANPSRRIGTLFVNPGGPGGTATDFAQFFPFLVRPAISNRFDIVGIDPRGTSQPYTVCRTDKPQPSFPSVAFPITPKQVAGWIRHDNWQRYACRTGPNPITNHMTTADTARDMDLIRQAVGDAKLTYYGISYGTYLGATYAAMFPDNVRAMIIDGVLDPVAWATGRGGSGTNIPFSTRLKSGYGASEALSSALARCDQVSRAKCALSGSATKTWNDLVRRLRRGPAKLDGGRLTYSDLVGGVLGFLYSADAYPELMKQLKALHQDIFGKGATRHGRPVLRAPRDDRGVAGPYGFGASYDAFHAVACADTVNPTDAMVWKRVADNFEDQQPWFGRYWTWASSTCARWPQVTSADAFRGPFNVVTSAPLLIIGNRHDPATPISGARAANTLFAGSRLLESKSWGHGALATGSCVSEAMRDYLTSLTLPAVGATCRPNQELFPAP
jgi:pimeloyl-ACP methyl ester carboxylesterase